MSALSQSFDPKHAVDHPAAYYSATQELRHAHLSNADMKNISVTMQGPGEIPALNNKLQEKPTSGDHRPQILATPKISPYPHPSSDMTS
jgi:hypothetical protein